VVLATSLGNVDGIAHVILDRIGKCAQILRLDPTQTTGLRGSSSVIKVNIVISLYYVKGAAIPLKISEELRQPSDVAPGCGLCQ